MRGKFITLEGMDGAGKSTHIPYIEACLRARGIEVVSTREPGGTPLGEQLRALLLHETMHPETEALLMFASRKEHVVQLIEPALTRGAYVLSDRFADASFAYQCGGRGVDTTKMECLEQWVLDDLQPDVTLLFDVPVEVSVERLSNARSPDKFERESAEFFARIRQAYLQRAARFPGRFRIVDSHRPLVDVRASIDEIIASL